MKYGIFGLPKFVSEGRLVGQLNRTASVELR